MSYTQLAFDNLTMELEMMSFGTIFFLTLFGGLFGGSAYLFHQINIKDRKVRILTEEVAAGQIVLLIISNGLVGFGGSAALVAARIYFEDFQKYQQQDAMNSILLLFSSVLAGFAAKTILPNLTNMLDRRLSQQDEKIEQQKKELQVQAETNEEQSKQLEEQNIINMRQSEEIKAEKAEFEIERQIYRAGHALSTTSVPSEHDAGIKGLSDVLEKRPTQRGAAIYLARIYRHKKTDLDAAISVLKKFVSSKLDVGEKDVDFADAHYNIACYYSLKSKESLDSNDLSSSKQYAENGLEALRTAVDFNQNNKADSATDPDLQHLRDSYSEEFKGIVGN